MNGQTDKHAPLNGKERKETSEKQSIIQREKKIKLCLNDRTVDGHGRMEKTDNQPTLNGKEESQTAETRNGRRSISIDVSKR